MKKILALALVLSMVLGLVSFAHADDDDVLSLFLGGGTPLSMDPALNSASAGSNIIRSAFAGLMGYRLNEAGEPVMSPELAESVDAVAPTVKLIKKGQKEGVFHKGNAETMAVAFWASVQGIMEYRTINRDMKMPEPEWIVAMLK